MKNILLNLVGIAALVPEMVFHVEPNGPTMTDIFCTVVGFTGFGCALFMMFSFPG